MEKAIKNKTYLDEGYYVGKEVYVWDLPEEKWDGSPYTGTEQNGRIAKCLGNETYIVELYDGNSVLVKEDALDD